MLNWLPPAPAEAPRSMLSASGALWAMEPKIDGARVIWCDGTSYTRHQRVLSAAQGAEAVTSLLAGVNVTLDGEWLRQEGVFYAFDLPDHPGDYAARRDALLALVVSSIHNDRIRCVDSLRSDFGKAYAAWRFAGAEGVVWKRLDSRYRAGRSRDWLKRRFCWD